MATSSPETLQVTARGVEFHCLAMGTGPVALLLHGFPDSARSWIPLMEQLAARGRRVIAPYMRGYAPTAVPADGCFQTAALSADAVALHEALGADELCFVSDVPGVMEEGNTIPTLDRAAIDDLIARGIAQGGMRAKLEAALVTLHAGVNRVRIAPIAGITDPSAGTTIALGDADRASTASASLDSARSPA